jgi:hypothetical protein
MLRTLCCLIVLHTTALAAQQSPFVGSWQVSYPVGATVENGVNTPILGTGVLEIAAAGDSLVGELNMDANDQFPPRPMQRLVASGAGPEATFIAHTEAQLNMNGEERTATVISTWKLAVKGDSLSGTVERVLEGFEMANQPPQPVTGVRRKR